KAASFIFDSRNRLRKVGSTLYTYDAENQRIAVTESGATTRYVINPNAPLSQVLIRVDQAGEKTYYVYGIGLIGQEKDGAYRSFHYDFRGSTVAMTDEVGNITHQYAYTAYGTVKAVQEEAFNPFRYVGQYGVMYEGNGLYYMRARYYQPELRRFLGEDPIWNKNLFAYAENNPLTGIDPLGLFCEDVQQERNALFSDVRKSAWEDCKNGDWLMCAGTFSVGTIEVSNYVADVVVLDTIKAAEECARDGSFGACANVALEFIKPIKVVKKANKVRKGKTKADIIRGLTKQKDLLTKSGIYTIWKDGKKYIGQAGVKNGRPVINRLKDRLKKYFNDVDRIDIDPAFSRQTGKVLSAGEEYKIKIMRNVDTLTNKVFNR
ncbi:MAG: RHS repeat-associated core domain-containing protein, partial [Candidatus Electrothrix sp. AUS4]|nr:RHS repeat-associated core domain-containing protein [Candidatus Electrothrix sp. AUS4]